jgi:[acyl-carrier-protein] S-malonyltransferase
MAQVLESIRFENAELPVVQNVTATAVTEGAELRRNLVQQVSAPVRWIECVEKMRDSGVRKIVEIGCGKVLSGLVKKIDSASLQTFNINSLDELKLFEQELNARVEK